MCASLDMADLSQALDEFAREGRFGCALQHDHLGIPSTYFLAVRFPGGPRFDLGLLRYTRAELLVFATDLRARALADSRVTSAAVATVVAMMSAIAWIQCTDYPLETAQ